MSDGVLWILIATVVPTLLVAATALGKALVLTGALRVGLGGEGGIPWQVAWVLALVLAVVAMGPTLIEIEEAIVLRGGVEGLAALDTPALLDVLEPLWRFVERHADPDEVVWLAELSGWSAEHPAARLGAFIIGELRSGLELAAAVLVPFVAVEIFVAQAATLAGLSGASLHGASLVAKLSLFVAVDGPWLVVERFAGSYGG
jgi:flagellar biosynthesis protein FliP